MPECCVAARRRSTRFAGPGNSTTMIDLATRSERSSLWSDMAADAGASAWPWLPPESPLAMPRQDCDAAGRFAPSAPVTSPANIVLRRYAVFGGAAFLTGLLAIGPYVLYGRAGF